MEKSEEMVGMQEVGKTEEGWESSKTHFVRKSHNDT